jgi:hypothetical protein
MIKNIMNNTKIKRHKPTSNASLKKEVLKPKKFILWLLIKGEGSKIIALATKRF